MYFRYQYFRVRLVVELKASCSTRYAESVGYYQRRETNFRQHFFYTWIGSRTSLGISSGTQNTSGKTRPRVYTVTVTEGDRNVSYKCKDNCKCTVRTRCTQAIRSRREIEKYSSSRGRRRRPRTSTYSFPGENHRHHHYRHPLAFNYENASTKIDINSGRRAGGVRCFLTSACCHPTRSKCGLHVCFRIFIYDWTYVPDEKHERNRKTGLVRSP